MEKTSSIMPKRIDFRLPSKTQTSPIETKKPENKQKDHSEEIVVGLSALAALALAGFAIARKPHKAGDMLQNVGHTPKSQKIQEAVAEGSKRAQNAIEEYTQGGNYQKIRREATKNLSHDGKKVAKKALEKAHSGKVANEIAQQHANSAKVMNTINANKAIGKANQGIHSAVSQAEIEARAISAKSAAAMAQRSADSVKEIAQEMPTHKNIKRAAYAQNQANRAQVQAQQVNDNALAELMAQGREKAAKARNIEALKASPNYQAGVEKQAQNAQKTIQSKVSRKLNQITQKPEYKRTLQDFQRKRYDGNKLIKIMENPNSSDVERFAAQELLEKLTK